jgi:hypothetical protein
VGLQYVVCSPAAVVTFVSTGVFSFTLVHNSVTLGLAGIFGIAGGLGPAGAAGPPGAWGAGGAPGALAAGPWTLGTAGGLGIPGMASFGGAGIAGRVYRFPSTSCPSIIDLPKSSTFTGAGWGVPPGAVPGAADGAEPGDAGTIGTIIASFFS